MMMVIVTIKHEHEHENKIRIAGKLNRKKYNSGPYCINYQHLFLNSQLLNVHTRAHPGDRIIDKCSFFGFQPHYRDLKPLEDHGKGSLLNQRRANAHFLWR